MPANGLGGLAPPRMALTYVMALIIDALAPTFGGQKDQTQALKAAAYAWTANWVAGIGLLVPWLGVLIALAGGIYSIYLLYLDLPATMKCSPEKAVGHTAVGIVCAIVLGWIVAIVAGGITGAGMLMSGAINGTSSTTPLDKDSWFGKLEAAGKQMDAARKSGDADAQAKAVGALMGATLGGGDKVEALTPDLLKPFVPETLAGLKRSSFSAERNGAMDMQVSQARATYSDGAGHSLDLNVSDLGSVKGLVKLAGWAGVEKSTTATTRPTSRTAASCTNNGTTNPKTESSASCSATASR
jgi:hypothetical protein